MAGFLDPTIGSDYLGVLIFGSDRSSYRRYTTRAYLDLARTLRTMSKSSRDERVEECKNRLLHQISRLESEREHSDSQDNFDMWHRETCLNLIDEFGASEMHYGQAQKWVNMTLKYLFAMGSVGIEDIGNISRAYSWAHMPIDRIIVNQLRKVGFPHGLLPKGSWSKMNQQDYSELQLNLREYFADECLMAVEFRLWKGL